jgi:signal transduction histidine kinase
VRNLVAAKRARDVLQAELASESKDVELLARELTLRKRDLQTALDSMRAARDIAERASQLKSDFLSLVSHELRTPISALLLQIDLRLREGPPPAGCEALQRMRATGRRLADTIEALLDAAAIESGRLHIEIGRLDAAALVAEVVQELQWQAAQKDLTLRLSAAPDLPPLECDARLFRVVVANLAGNAVKFTVRGGVDVSLSSGGGQHRLEVRDTGPGIPVEEQARIFEPFVQLEPIRRKHLPGMGLGLALVKQLVTALGGEIALESEVGRGSRFTVMLPSRPADNAAAWAEPIARYAEDR